MYSEQFLAGTFHQKQTTFNRWIDNIADCIDRYYLHRIVDYDQICWQQGRRYRIVATLLTCAVIFKQYMGARNQVEVGLSYRPARLQRLAEFGSLELILGLLKSLKIRALVKKKPTPFFLTIQDLQPQQPE
jgi:hypothetical protein